MGGVGWGKSEGKADYVAEETVLLAQGADEQALQQHRDAERFRELYWARRKRKKSAPGTFGPGKRHRTAAWLYLVQVDNQIFQATGKHLFVLFASLKNPATEVTGQLGPSPVSAQILALMNWLAITTSRMNSSAIWISSQILATECGMIASSHLDTRTIGC